MKLNIGQGPDRIPLGVFAGVTDKTAKKAEVMDTDQIRIVQLLYDLLEGVLHLTLQLGSLDSSGKWHADPAFQTARLTMQRGTHPAWEQYGMDSIEGFDWKTLKQMLDKEGIIEMTARNWWKIPDCVSAIDGAWPLIPPPEKVDKEVPPPPAPESKLPKP
jgi:hypothetical protein